MPEKVDPDTRYYIDLDLDTRTAIGWNSGSRYDLINQDPASPAPHRSFVTKGQYNKLV